MARAASGARINPVSVDDGIAPRAATTRVQRRRHSLQPATETAQEPHWFSSEEQDAIRFSLSLLQGKWKVGILCRLQEGPVRPGELRRLFPKASKKMLTQHLRQMERDGLIIRTDKSGKVPHVEYSLSRPYGLAVFSILEFLATWRVEYRLQQSAAAAIELFDSGCVIQEAVLQNRERRAERKVGTAEVGKAGSTGRRFIQECPITALLQIGRRRESPSPKH